MGVICRTLNTPVDAVEDWEVDKILAYYATASRLLDAEKPKK